MTPPEAHEVVRRVGWLSLQPLAFQDRLLRDARLIRVRAGESLYGNDALPDGIYGIAAGMIDVVVAPGPFPARLVQVLRPGWWIGETMTPAGTRRVAELTVRSDASVLQVSAQHLERIVSEKPQLRADLASLILRHLDDALFHAACLSTADPTLRLAGTLARMIGRDPREIWVALHLTQDELATLACVSRNSVGRALGQLEAAGCLVRQYGRIEIRSARLWTYLETAEL
ncbi:Crp/Fnr family transcriptional regulator [Tropicimonas sp. IMCC34043]|uniref:Crp/Fnr family transcriptional regulator n=1 Tax=Tropicimonas sp. IMCC34043 TaxID=2248760 RepID=UPI000E27E665|nr:Crp/Fnr family transcriptional regulator [Tropicimonas sp. IMCC34043]